MAISYRPEIDGMRAVAVLSVIVYHLRMPSPENYILPGGFLGVDVFFVLSGFLITSIVAKEIATTGKFDVSDFYLRRARRIIPPLFLVIFATIPAAYALLLPSEMETFASSLWAAVGFYSNIFWYFELGEYGSQSGLLQPFLHTWSLAIEEQFYLVWPFFLLLLMRFLRTRILLVTSLIFVVSLVVAQMTTDWKADVSFFSTASRGWELLAGALLALSSKDLRPLAECRALLRYLPTIGLALVIFSMLFVSLGSGYHPGLATIPTVLGTCAMIAFANPRDPTTKLLAAVPLVFVGKLSYSLYLWHFPIFAFGRLAFAEPADWIDWSAWTALTFALSYIGYRLVEKPLRFALPTRPFLALLAGATVLVLSLPVALKNIDMDQAPMAQRLGPIYGGNDFDNERLRDESWAVLDAVPGGRTGASKPHDPSPNEVKNLWFSPDARLRVLFVGNSHSKDIFNAFHLNQSRFPGMEFARFGMTVDFKPKQVELLVNSPNFKAADVIALAPYWRGKTDLYDTVISRLKAEGKQIVLLNNTAVFTSPSHVPFADFVIRGSGALPETEKVNGAAWGQLDPSEAHIRRKIEALAERHDVPIYSRFDLVCEAQAKRCAILSDDGRKTLYDYGHWTVHGARFFGGRASDADWFGEFRD